MTVKFNQLLSLSTILFAIGSSSYAEIKQSAAKNAPSFKQGYSLCDKNVPAAYNASARIDVQNRWDFFLSGSFIYWHADQEGMDIAYRLEDSIAVQSFKFKPGFKIGLGLDFNYDQWIGSAEYTRLHQQTRMSKTAPSSNPWVVTDWLATSIMADHLKSKWRSNFDILDVSLSRPYYLSRRITVTPYGGVRAAWIRQNLHIDAVYTPDSNLPWVSYNQSHAWGAGPRAGIQGHWLLGAGFRMEGDLFGSLLFSRFTKISHREVNALDETVYALKYHNYNTLRPMTEMNLGLGWGSYFDRQHYHFDLLATYDFSVMWGQNMMRSLVDTYLTHSTFEAADLHLQGLTLTARFDF